MGLYVSPLIMATSDTRANVEIRDFSVHRWLARLSRPVLSSHWRVVGQHDTKYSRLEHYHNCSRKED